MNSGDERLNSDQAPGPNILTSDVALANAELAGCFPPDVRLRSVLALHGDLTADTEDDLDAIIHYHMSVGRALIGADRVGVEVAYSSRSSSELTAAFAKVNAYARQVELGIAASIGLQTGFEASLFGMVQGLYSAGADKMPIFFPIDAATADPELGQQARQVGSLLTLRDRILATAALNRKREGIVVRQALSAAQGLSTPGDDNQHIIALVQGSDHFRTIAALEQLGASTEEPQFVSPRLDSPFGRLVEKVRELGVDSLSYEDVIYCSASTTMAERLLELAGGDDHLLHATSRYERTTKRALLLNAVSLACIDALSHTLDPALQQIFDRYTECQIAQNQPGMAEAARQFVEYASVARSF